MTPPRRVFLSDDLSRGLAVADGTCDPMDSGRLARVLFSPGPQRLDSFEQREHISRPKKKTGPRRMIQQRRRRAMGENKMR